MQNCTAKIIRRFCLSPGVFFLFSPKHAVTGRNTGAIASRRDLWVDLHVINIYRRNSFSIAVFCPDIAAEFTTKNYSGPLATRRVFIFYLVQNTPVIIDICGRMATRLDYIRFQIHQSSLEMF